MINQETIDKILSISNIVEVINEFVTLKKKGVNYVGCCPFHSEKTPSFVVSPVKSIYKCFGCGRGGNVVQFVQEHETFTYPEALRFLAKRLNIEIAETTQSQEEKDKANRWEQLKIIHEFASLYFQSETSNSKAKDYLATRRVSPEIIQKFRLGYAPAGWRNLVNTAKNKQYNENLLIDASLANQSEKGIHDYFRNRIMFPFFDLRGNVIGFTGRILDTCGDDAKYLNSKDTDLFNKGKVLYGLFQAKRAIVQKDECYLVEGNFDVTSFHQAGIENTVCGSGTAFKIEQIRLIRKFTNNITIIYDGDPAGIKASFRTIDLMLAEDIDVRAIALPAGEDPDSFAGKLKPKDLAKYLEVNRKDFITFKYEILKADIEKDPLKEADLIRELLGSVAIIPDQVTKDLYKKHCIHRFNIDEKVVSQALLNAPKQAKNEGKKNGWIGLEWAIDAIREDSKVFITSDVLTMYSQWDTENSNTIAFAGVVPYSQLQELNSITHNVFILDAITTFYEKNGAIPEIIKLCKQLYEFKFDVKVSPSDEEITNEEISFIDQFFLLAAKELNRNEYDQNVKNRVIEQCAELFSKSDNTTININSKTFADRIKLKEGDFKKILKPYLEKKKSSQALQTDVFDDDGENKRFEPDHLPDYVDHEFYTKWGYFPYQNAKGVKVRYVFRTQEAGLQVIGNFYIEPCFHVYDPDPNNNKRIVKINNAEQKTSYYMEINSSAMIEFAQFKKVLFNEGGNIFTKGKANHHEIILASIANSFPKCWELKIFGQQHEGFWAFANAIVADGKVTYMDDLGLVPFMDKVYYSPAFSKIYSGNRKDDDKYELVRYFIYRENADTTFEEWAKLLDDVYHFNSNGKWSILYAIMAAFRSIIYPLDRLFTSPFFIGPTESGKTQIAVSIRSLFMSPEAPLFNLNSGSDAAFFTNMERFRDVPLICEEYNDYQITDIKFQGLKAAVYDGEGKQKRKDATSKDLDISKVNAPPIILGQEGPEKDDGSLGNRCVICHVPKKDDWTEEESNLFRLLKQKEKDGLTNVLLEILKQRDIIAKNFQRIQRSVFKEMKIDLNKTGSTYQTRILNTISLFTAICKLWEDHVPTLKLPFSYAEFFDVAKAKIIAQSEAIMATNRVSVFFDTLDLLLNRPFNGLTPGKEFKIEVQKSITVQKNRNETAEIDLGSATKVLYLRMNILHPMYSDVRKNEALKMNNLLTYLKDHASHIGAVKSTRFKWTEIYEQADPFDNRVTKIGREASINTAAMAFRYELLDIDLEKYTEPTLKVEYNNTDKPDAQQTLDLKASAEDDVPF